mgnify:CR=1 FL=1
MYHLNGFFRGIKKLFSFSKEKQLKETMPEEVPEPLMSFKLNLCHDGSLDLVCNWDHNNQNVILGTTFGQILYNLTTGEYNKIISEVFLESADADQEIDELFVKSVVIFLQNNPPNDDATKLLSGQPLIHPLQTFGESHCGRSEE